MPTIVYRYKRISDKRLQTIATANAIIREYAAQLTLRQLDYQFVARGYI